MCDSWKWLHRSLKWLQPVTAFRFQRPILLIQSDDWGLTGIPDSATYDRLRQKGIALGQHPFDRYSLESADDLRALYSILGKHHDSRGRAPAIVFNFISANVDFAKVAANQFKELFLQPLHQGLPVPWHRPGLLDAYREGIEAKLVYPALHGLTHFNLLAARTVLERGGERRERLVSLYEEGIPQLYSYTPWLGYEFRAGDGIFADPWLAFQQQVQAVAQAIQAFETTFGHKPISACAPGYRANDDTYRAFAQLGIRIVQDGLGIRAAPYYDRCGLLHLHRNVALEPVLNNGENGLEQALEEAKLAIRRGWPVIVSTHSINYQSALNHSERSLAVLDDFLTALEQRYPNLLYMHDEDLLNLVEGHEMDRGPSVSAYWSLQPETQHAIRQRIWRF